MRLLNSQLNWQAKGLAAFRRSALLIALALSIALNLSSGEFTGYLHIHEHHHPHGEDDHHHHDANGHHPEIIITFGQTDGVPAADHGNQTIIHEHGAAVVLALVGAKYDTLTRKIRESVSAVPAIQTPSNTLYPFERPPRHV